MMQQTRPQTNLFEPLTHRISKSRLLVCVLCIFLGGLLAQASPLEKLERVKSSDISLDGTWHFQIPASEGFWSENKEPIGWKTMPVPGDVFREGHLIKEDEPVAYKRKVMIPADFKGQQIRLRFEGAHEYTRVWVSGQYIGDHQGGWTPWECNITDAVSPGKEAWIALEITDISNDIAFNGKRLRPIGGLVRSVTLQARPKTILEFPVVSSPFSTDGKTATLTVTGQVEHPDPKATASFRLFDPEGKEVRLSEASCRLDSPEVTWKARVDSPARWDAEHPRLYRLEITSKAPGQSTAVYSKRIGFREITFDDKKNMLINGKVVKLRGANRHLVNPLKGFVPEVSVDKRDVELFKEANMNFVRTSHYPPGIGFVDQCDEQGLYVTLESAVLDCGKNNRPTEGMNDDPQYEHLFVNQQREVVLNYGSHPSIILWSICNESVFGKNFQAAYDEAHKLDPSRPAIASYQVKKDPEHKSYDVKSSHYPQWDQNYEVKDVPTIYDEWMHVLGHTAELWLHDPNSRDYWGRSLDKAWNNLFPANGSVGAAIWNYVDDMTICPEPTNKTAMGAVRLLPHAKAKIPVTGVQSNIYGTARWGIIDEWRRPKPEFWNVKKAYSPVRVLDKRAVDFSPGKPISLRVANRFDHTSLDEVTLRVTYDGKTKEVACPAIAPHEEGIIELPAANWKEGAEIGLSFLNASNQLIDDYKIALGAPVKKVAPAMSGVPEVTEDASTITVRGKDFTIQVDRATGLIQCIKANEAAVPLVGPIPHLFKLEEFLQMGINPDIGPDKPVYITKTVSYDSPMGDAWVKSDLKIEKTDHAVVIRVTGKFDGFDASYTYTIAANGRFDIGYGFKNIPPLDTENKKAEFGGPQHLEVGIKFQSSDQFDTLEWDRQAYWSSYPADHPGRPKGKLDLFSTDKPTWAKKPSQPWHKDVWDFYFMGWGVPEGKLLPYEASAAREAINTYTLGDRDGGVALTVYGDGEKTSARFGQYKDKSYYLYLLDTLSYHLRWGNYSADHRPSSDHKGVATLMLGSLK